MALKSVIHPNARNSYLSCSIHIRKTGILIRNHIQEYSNTTAYPPSKVFIRNPGDYPDLSGFDLDQGVSREMPRQGNRSGSINATGRIHETLQRARHFPPPEGFRAILRYGEEDDRKMEKNRDGSIFEVYIKIPDVPEITSRPLGFFYFLFFVNR